MGVVSSNGWAGPLVGGREVVVCGGGDVVRELVETGAGDELRSILSWNPSILIRCVRAGVASLGFGVRLA